MSKCQTLRLQVNARSPKCTPPSAHGGLTDLNNAWVAAMAVGHICSNGVWSVIHGILPGLHPEIVGRRLPPH